MHVRFSVRKKGIALERKVANMLWRLGYAVVRSPASGSAKKRPEPDLIIIKNGKALAIELCYRSKIDNIKVEVTKVERMKKFVEHAGIQLFLCVKYNDSDILCIDYTYLFNQLMYKPKRYVCVEKDKILRHGKKLLELIKELLG